MKIALLLAAALLVARLASAQDTPTPPEQTRPWTAPTTTLPPAVVSAVAELFDLGMSDPRGCGYREIEIGEGRDFVIKTRGWVLPDTGGKHYAVAWNGLVYPVDAIGAAAD